jgi:hypothetical protein
MTMDLQKDSANSRLTFHERCCAVRDLRIGLLFVAIFALESLLAWRGLNRPVQRISLFELPFVILAFLVVGRFFWMFRCLRERLVLGFGMIAFAISVTLGFFPGFMESPLGETLKIYKLVLWFLSFVISASMIVPSNEARKSA